MKKVLFLAASFVMLAFTSWTHPNASRRLSTPPEQWNEHIVEDASGVFYNPCAEEWIDMTLTMYWINTGVQNDNRSNSVWNFKWKGTGIGLTTGTQYIINEHDNSVFNISMQNGQLAWNGQHKFNWISQGKGPNYSIQWNIHFVINAKGEIVLEDYEELDIDCH